METQGWYTVNEFAPGSYQITEAGRFKTYLLLGGEKALAIDGGLGVANLCRLHESITDLPIDFVLTHTHWDHVGCAHLWEKVGVHPGGKDCLAQDLSRMTAGFVKMWTGAGNAFPEGFDPAAFRIPPATFGWTLQEGDAFDLGGRRLRVFDTPGHSHDSISFLDEREGVLVSGDLIKPHDTLFLQLPTSRLADYPPSLRKLEKIAGEVKWICSGHNDPFDDTSIIGEMAQGMEEVAAGKHGTGEKVDGGPWGEVDEYAFPRFKAWVQDHAR